MGLRTFKSTRPASRYGSPLAKPLISLALLALAGCQGMYLHQPDRAATASTAKKSIELVDVQAITKTENDNLARMLKQELNAVDARSTLVSSLAVIQMSANEESIAGHYTQSLKIMAGTLDGISILAINKMQRCSIDQQTDMKTRPQRAGSLVDMGLNKAPECKLTGMAENITEPAGLTVSDSARFKKIYKEYKASCEIPQSCFPQTWSAELTTARAEAEAAKNTVSSLKDEIAAARSQYEEALRQNTDAKTKSSKTGDDVKNTSKQLKDLLEKISSTSPSAATQLRLEALVELLSNAAGQPVEKGDPQLAGAATIAASLPSLAQSINVAHDTSQQIPVSHLLIALNHLLIAGERDARLATLDVEKISALQRSVDAREQQATLFRAYSDQLCNLAFSASNRALPGKPCDTLVFQDTGGATRCIITLDTGDVTPIENCVLGRSWRTLLKEGSLADVKTPARQVEARRALYEAAAAYLQMRLLAQKALTENFNVVDVNYRRSTVQTEATLNQWKSVVSIPAGELDGYYSGGTKPAEVADLLIKAVGFTAIAIGVSK